MEGPNDWIALLGVSEGLMIRSFEEEKAIEGMKRTYEEDLRGRRDSGREPGESTHYGLIGSPMRREGE